MEDKKCIGAISLWGFEKDRLIIRFAPINDGTIRLLFYNYNDDYYKNTNAQFIKTDIERRLSLRDDETFTIPFLEFHNYIAMFLNGIHETINSITALEPALFNIIAYTGEKDE